MSLCSVADYRAHTCDLASSEADVLAALTDAQSLLEAELDRPLEYTPATTETLTPYRDEWGQLCVMPRRVPVISTTDGTVRAGEREIVSPTAFGVFVSRTYWQDHCSDPLPIDLTFEGGWKAQGAGDHEVPLELARAVCFIAQALIRQGALAGVGLAGASSATVGDVSVSWAEPTGEGLDRYVPGITCRIERYAYRSIL